MNSCDCMHGDKAIQDIALACGKHRLGCVLRALVRVRRFTEGLPAFVRVLPGPTLASWNVVRKARSLRYQFRFSFCLGREPNQIAARFLEDHFMRAVAGFVFRDNDIVFFCELTYRR